MFQNALCFIIGFFFIQSFQSICFCKQDQDLEDARRSVLQWLEDANKIKHWKITVLRKGGDDNHSSIEKIAHSKGRFSIFKSITISNAKENVSVFLANDRYSARLAKKAGQDWEMLDVVVSSGNLNENAFQQESSKLSTRLIEPYLLNRLLGDGPYEQVTFSKEMTPENCRLVLKFGGLTNGNNHGEELHLHSLTEAEFVPMKIELRELDKNVVTIKQFLYEDGKVVPYKVIMNGYMGDTLMAEEVLDVQFDQSIVNAFDKSECYLSHYGFPEPELPFRFEVPVYFYVALVLVLIIVGVGFFKRRGK